jgi:hypothetical protein
MKRLRIIFLMPLIFLMGGMRIPPFGRGAGIANSKTNGIDRTYPDTHVYELKFNDYQNSMYKPNR